MSRSFGSCDALVACVSMTFTFGAAGPVWADAFDTYGASYRMFSTPPVGDGSFGVAGDALPDGRLVMVTGNSVFLESGVGTGAFDEVGILDASQTGGATDPSFLSVSPDGSRIAIGVGFAKPVAVFDTTSLGVPNAPADLTSGSVASYFGVNHFDAAWFDGDSLAISAGNFGEPAYVSLLDTTSDPQSPINEHIVTNIRGASGGIAFDEDGTLFTGNGFADGSGSDTGALRAFSLADWSGGADFETQGVFVGDVLSGNALAFDAEGNLFVGGGDFSNFDAGYLGVIDAGALGSTLDGFGPIDTSDPGQLKRLDPRADGFGFFGSAYNTLTGELYVADGATWYATVPAPGTAGLLGLAGAFASRRRRG